VPQLKPPKLSVSMLTALATMSASAEVHVEAAPSSSAGETSTPAVAVTP
jgi:hypothetical protein